MSVGTERGWVRRGTYPLDRLPLWNDTCLRWDTCLRCIHCLYYQDRFLCRAICAELSGEKVTLKEIEKARSERRKQVRAGLSIRAAIVNRFIEVHQEQTPPPKTLADEPAPVEARPRLKRYINE